MTNPIPRTVRSLELKLARKVSKPLHRDLQGLLETLAPGSTVVRASPTTTAIKGPAVPEVKVRNIDIAKFGTRAERNSELWQYAQRRPLPYDKTTEENIAQQSKELKKKYRGDIKIRHRQDDSASGISSTNSNISKAKSSRKPKKPQAGTSRSRKSSIPNTSAASSMAASSAASSIASPTTSKGKRNRKAPEYLELLNLRAQYALLVILRQCQHLNAKDLRTLYLKQ